MTSLWWVRRDARLADNPALLAAQADGAAAAVFAWTPALHRWSGRRSAHLARVLWSLRADTNGALGVRRGAAADVVLAAAREHGSAVVHAAREFTPSGIREQDSVGAALAADGRELLLTGSPYAVPPGEVVKADGSEYQVFTPFLRAWRDHGWPPAARRAGPHALLATTSDVSVDLYAAHGDAEDLLSNRMEFREGRWLDRLTDFIDQDLSEYNEDRDRPDRDATSHLSVPLAFGQIHPRTILSATRVVHGPAARKFEAELAWREFHADVLFRHPRALRESLRTVILDDDWETGPAADAAFIAWREGLTGFPIVDAGMRELKATGDHAQPRAHGHGKFSYQRPAPAVATWRGLFSPGAARLRPRAEPIELAVGCGHWSRRGALFPHLQSHGARAEVRPRPRLHTALGGRG